MKADTLEIKVFKTRTEMGKKARSLSVDDSLDRITAALLKLVKTP